MSRWVCLMYHDVLARTPGVSGGTDYFGVSQAVFAAQLDQLLALGLHGCSMEQALRGVARGVAITFDDGDAGQFDRAFPALVARGMTATFFVTTDRVGTPDHVSWEGLREMRSAGMSIQSHTRSHPFLSELSPAALREELLGSREDIDEQLGQRTTSLALPGGDAPRAALRPLLTEAGYTAIATSRWGVNDAATPGAPAWVRRCTVRGDQGPVEFRRIVEGDPRLSLQRRVRGGALHALRASLGPSRYARWRRAFLNAAGAGEQA